MAQRVPRSRNSGRPRRLGCVTPVVSCRGRAIAATRLGPAGWASVRRVQGLHRSRWRAQSGELSLAPLFAGTRYLVETGPVMHLLSTERDLLQNSAVLSGRGLLAFGGPSYDVTPASTVASTRGNDVGCGNGVALRFGDLPGTRTEVADIARVWTMRTDASSSPARDDLLVLDRRAASKAAVMQAARGRLVLHFATHGLVLSSECQPTAAGTRGVGGLAVTAGPISRSRPSQNPLLLSGLAFAGANVRASVRRIFETPASSPRKKSLGRPPGRRVGCPLRVRHRTGRAQGGRRGVRVATCVPGCRSTHGHHEPLVG